MSNGLKLGLGQHLRIEQRIGVYLAPLMTPVLRPRRTSSSPNALDSTESPDEARGLASSPGSEDELAPWREPRPSR